MLAVLDLLSDAVVVIDILELGMTTRVVGIEALKADGETWVVNLELAETEGTECAKDTEELLVVSRERCVVDLLILNGKKLVCLENAEDFSGCDKISVVNCAVSNDCTGVERPPLESDAGEALGSGYVDENVCKELSTETLLDTGFTEVKLLIKDTAADEVFGCVDGLGRLIKVAGAVRADIPDALAARVVIGLTVDVTTAV